MVRLVVIYESGGRSVGVAGRGGEKLMPGIISSFPASSEGEEHES